MSSTMIHGIRLSIVVITLTIGFFEKQHVLNLVDHLCDQRVASRHGPDQEQSIDEPITKTNQDYSRDNGDLMRLVVIGLLILGLVIAFEVFNGHLINPLLHRDPGHETEPKRRELPWSGNQDQAAFLRKLIKQSNVNPEFLKVLGSAIESGIDLEASSSSGQTALHIAATDGTVEVVRMLVAAGADVNSMDRMGKTPLAIALQGATDATDPIARTRLRKVARELLNHGGHASGF